MSAHRGCSSVGRALAWHARGRRFESDQLHQYLGYRLCDLFRSYDPQYGGYSSVG